MKNIAYILLGVAIVMMVALFYFFGMYLAANVVGGKIWILFTFGGILFFGLIGRIIVVIKDSLRK
jgi:hypothetical protein